MGNHTTLSHYVNTFHRQKLFFLLVESIFSMKMTPNLYYMQVFTPTKTTIYAFFAYKSFF